MTAVAVLQAVVPAPPPGTVVPIWSVGGLDVVTRTPGGTAVLGYMPVLPMLIGSSLLMFVVSRLTPGPATATLRPVLPGARSLSHARDAGARRAAPRGRCRYQSYASDATALIPGLE